MTTIFTSGAITLALCAAILALGTESAEQALPSAKPYPPVSELKPNPELPDPLVKFDGTRVKDKRQWTRERRPELKRLIQHYMYGYTPPPPHVRSKVERVNAGLFGGKATLKEVTLRFGPESAPPIHLMVITPNKRHGPVPAFLGIAFCGNQAIVDDPQVRMAEGWMYNAPGVVNNRATEATRGTQQNTWPAEMIVDRGYALATFYNGDVDPDVNDFSNGVHPFFMRSGQTTLGPHDWGTIAAWAWGMQRALDYLVKVKEIDPKRIAAIGHSRNGKTALLAGAFDERFALAIPHQAGCGGTAPSRGKVGESVKAINAGFPHWFNDTFPQFNDCPELLPFDQNGLVALMAPRPVLFSNAEDDTWANPAGQFDVLKAADGVFRFLGVEGLNTREIPPMGKLLESRLGYFIRSGQHSMTRIDWGAFLDFADRHLGRPGE